MGFFEKFGKKAGETIAGVLKGISATTRDGETIFDLITTANNLPDVQKLYSYDSFKSINKVVQSLNSPVGKLKSSKTDCIKNFSEKYKEFSDYYKKNHTKFSVLDEKNIEFNPESIDENKAFNTVCNELNKQKDKIQKLKTEFLDDVKAKGTIEINKIKIKIYEDIIIAINNENIEGLESECSNLLKKINDENFKKNIEKTITDIKSNLDVIEDNSQEKVDSKKLGVSNDNATTMDEMGKKIKGLKEKIKVAQEKIKASELEKLKKEALDLKLEIITEKHRIHKNKTVIYSASELFNEKTLFSKQLPLESLKSSLTADLISDSEKSGINDKRIPDYNQKIIDTFINRFYEEYSNYFKLNSKKLDEFKSNESKKLSKELENTSKEFDVLKKEIAGAGNKLEKQASKNTAEATKKIENIKNKIVDGISNLNSEIEKQEKKVVTDDAFSSKKSDIEKYNELQSKLQKAYVAYINVLDDINSKCDDRKRKINKAYIDLKTINSKIDNCLGIFDNSSVDEIKKKVKEIRENKTKAENLNSNITLGQVLSGVYYRMSEASKLANNKIISYNKKIEEIKKEKDTVENQCKIAVGRYNGSTKACQKPTNNKKK